MLHYKRALPVAQTLLRRAYDFQQQRNWVQAERCAQDASEICQEGLDHIGAATARLCLADIYCEMGELGRAMEECKAAYQLFSHQSAQAQRHNGAVAAYVLGVLCERRLFDYDQKALYWYREALQQLDVAQEYWATQNSGSRFKTCRRLKQRIKSQCEAIVERRANRPPWQAAFDIWRLDSTNSPFADSDLSQGYVVDRDRALINGVAYRFPSDRLPEPGVDEKYYHFALPTTRSRGAIQGTQVGDYVFIRQQWQIDRESKGIVWRPGSGWIVVDFERGQDDKIRFSYRDPEIIGDPADKLTGYIIGLLKPEK